MKFPGTIVVLMLLCPVGLVAQDKAASVEVKPKRVIQTYRLTYTVTESDGTKRLGVQHFSTLIRTQPGNRASIKLGSKVPVTTGSGSGAQTTYMDVGMNINAFFIPDDDTSGSLNTMVDQSSLIESPTGGEGRPVIRQTELSSNVALPSMKPVLLGSLDTPGSTRHLDVELSMELVP